MTPPTDKQIRYAAYLSRSTGKPLPPGWDKDRGICGSFIAAAKRGNAAEPEYSDVHTRRILGGGPLKHDPGPWDEGWAPD